MSLYPFQLSEIPEDLQEESIFRGGYPELVDSHYKFYNQWFSPYVETYIHKDIASVGHVGDIRDFITKIMGSDWLKAQNSTFMIQGSFLFHGCRIKHSSTLTYVELQHP